MRKLFGTDGIRGKAGQYPLDRNTIYRIGRALGHHLKASTEGVRVVLGQDTRESSPWIADAMAAGLASVHAKPLSAGVVTTPAIAYLTRTHGFQAGAVISASHNPWEDNGIKIFGPDGFKLPDRVELEIEKEIFSQIDQASKADAEVEDPSSSAPIDTTLAQDYELWLKSLISGTDFRGIQVVVDCANGAASPIAPEIFTALGISAHYTHREPNGRNINEKCGALHAEVVAKEVVERGADLGVTFDGDADRALFADARGQVVNGDAVMLILARELKAEGRLKKDTVVATTMSNMGLEAVLHTEQIKMLRAPVGDKYVLEEMQKIGASLGGEQSGHIILSEISTTGDGILTALMVLQTVARRRKPIADLIADLKVYPQVIKNVRVREKQPLETIPSVTRTIQEAEKDLQGAGRVVVRYSGTEALARVMIEAESREKMTHHAEAIAAAIRQELGA